MTTPDRTAEIRARHTQDANLIKRGVWTPCGLDLQQHENVGHLLTELETLRAALAASEAREKELREQLDRMNLAGKAPSP